MPEEPEAPDLLDLKLLPAWVKETPNEKRYADYAGEEPDRAAQGRQRDRPERRPRERRERGPRPHDRPREDRPRRHGAERRPERERPRAPRIAERPPARQLPIALRFVPDRRVLESVLAQIKSSHVAYSVFSLARMFLEKPERYDVRLKAESGEFFQLGENGPVSGDRRILENGAFLSEKDRFYRTEVTQSEPIKGNFNSVARCRLSGVLLGPTNYHAYQAQLRNLYEQRFSRRMSFPDYQRQIEIVSDPEAVERWKEEARTVTTYVAIQEDPEILFKSAAETERHFRQSYLPGLLRSTTAATLDGVVSRRLSDRSLGRWIEDAWAREFRSPIKMMQELTNAFRHVALHIFRHHKGMLFVSPIRARPFTEAASSFSSSIAGIVAALKETPGLNRKALLEKLQPDQSEEARAQTKRTLASELHWLIGEGHVIEFNDGTLDLPRMKTAPPAGAPNGAGETAISPNEPEMLAAAPGEEKSEAAPEIAAGTFESAARPDSAAPPTVETSPNEPELPSPAPVGESVAQAATDREANGRSLQGTDASNALEPGPNETASEPGPLNQETSESEESRGSSDPS